MINEARRFEHVLGLEQAFTVVYWDQRGCGRSLRHARPGRHQPGGDGGDTVSLLDFSGTVSAGRHMSPGSRSERRSGRTPPRSARTGATLVAVGMDIDGAPPAPCLRLRARRGPPARPPARDPAAAGDRPAPAPDLETVHHPGPLGDQLRRGHDRRNLRHPGARAAREPGALTRLPGRRRHPDHPRYQRDQAALLPELATLDLARTVPRLDVPVVMVQLPHQRVSKTGGAAAAPSYAILSRPSARHRLAEMIGRLLLPGEVGG